MTPVKKHLWLKDLRAKAMNDRSIAFEVTKAQNTAIYTIGQTINQEEADRRCNDRYWTVTITK
jgi:hypothetical protein